MKVQNSSEKLANIYKRSMCFVLINQKCIGFSIAYKLPMKFLGNK